MSELSQIEKELAKLTQQLAEFLLLPPLERSTPGFAKVWRPISRYRVLLRTALREKGSALADPRTRSGNQPEIEMQMRYNAATHRLRLWPQIEDLVNKQVTLERRDLMAPISSYMDGTHNRYVNSLYSALHALALPPTEAMRHRIQGSHADISLPATHFEALCHAAYRVCLAQGRNAPLRFLDVGCGGGTKIVAASSFFPIAHGIDNHPSSVKMGQSVVERLGFPRGSVTEANALTFDGYGDYDIIYFFRPISVREDLKAMEDRILANARPGTILIAPYHGFTAEHDDPRCANISPSIYVAHEPPYQVEHLRKRAELIGNDAPPHDSAASGKLGYWKPVIEASRRNGYGL